MYMGTWLHIATLCQYLWLLPNNINHLQIWSLPSISSRLLSRNDYVNCNTTFTWILYPVWLCQNFGDILHHVSDSVLPPSEQQAASERCLISRSVFLDVTFQKNLLPLPSTINMEAIGCFKMLELITQTAWCYISEKRDLHIHCHEHTL
jgi:predicted restriction endonuclease